MLSAWQLSLSLLIDLLGEVHLDPSGMVITNFSTCYESSARRYREVAAEEAFLEDPCLANDRCPGT